MRRKEDAERKEGRKENIGGRKEDIGRTKERRRMTELRKDGVRGKERRKEG